MLSPMANEAQAAVKALGKKLLVVKATDDRELGAAFELAGLVKWAVLAPG